MMKLFSLVFFTFLASSFQFDESSILVEFFDDETVQITIPSDNVDLFFVDGISVTVGNCGEFRYEKRISIFKEEYELEFLLQVVTHAQDSIEVLKIVQIKDILPATEKRLSCSLRALQRSLIEAENLYNDGKEHKYSEILDDSFDVDEKLKRLDEDVQKLEAAFTDINKKIDENEEQLTSLEPSDDNLKSIEERLNVLYNKVSEKVKSTAKHLELISKKANLHFELIKILNEPNEESFDFVVVDREGAFAQSFETDTSVSNNEIDDASDY